MKCPKHDNDMIFYAGPDNGYVKMLCRKVGCGEIVTLHILSPAGLEAVKWLLKRCYYPSDLEQIRKEIKKAKPEDDLDLEREYVKDWDKFLKSDPLLAAVAKKIEEGKP